MQKKLKQKIRVLLTEILIISILATIFFLAIYSGDKIISLINPNLECIKYCLFEEKVEWQMKCIC